MISWFRQWYARRSQLSPIHKRANREVRRSQRILAVAEREIERQRTGNFLADQLGGWREEP